MSRGNKKGGPRRGKKLVVTQGSQQDLTGAEVTGAGAGEDDFGQELSESQGVGGGEDSFIFQDSQETPRDGGAGQQTGDETVSKGGADDESMSMGKSLPSELDEEEKKGGEAALKRPASMSMDMRGADGVTPEKVGKNARA